MHCVLKVYIMLARSSTRARCAIMGQTFGNQCTLVEVRTDSFIPKSQLWVAAAKPEQAVTLVLCAVPEGWTATIADGTFAQASGDPKSQSRRGPPRSDKVGRLNWWPFFMSLVWHFSDIAGLADYVCF